LAGSSFYVHQLEQQGCKQSLNCSIKPPRIQLTGVTTFLAEGGEHRALAKRPDVFWASSLEELVLRLFAEPERLQAIPVAPPPYWELKDLLKALFAP